MTRSLPTLATHTAHFRVAESAEADGAGPQEHGEDHLRTEWASLNKSRYTIILC